MSKRRRPHVVAQPALPAESLQAEAVTVAWLVSWLFALLMEVALLVLGLVVIAGYQNDRIWVLTRLILAAGTLVGLMTVGLSYAVWRVRRTVPPRGMLPTAVISSLIPAAVLLAWLIRQGS